MRHAICTILTALGLLSLTGSASALDLLANGKFDSSLNGWGGCCGNTGTTSWDASRDASGSDLSGSAALAHTVAVSDPPANLFLSRCISGPSVQAGSAFFIGAKVRFREGETSDGKAYLSVEFRPDDNCQSSSLVGGGADVVPAGDFARGTWIPLALGSTANGVVAPVGTHSMRVGVVVYKLAGTTLTINVDDFFAASAGTPVCDGMPATIVGTANDEFLPGTTASDVIVGRGGIDLIDGKAGNDRLCGGPGADVLYGGPGDDRVFGEGGADDLYGAGDDDLLSGAGGNDDLYGGDGLDKLKGGTGQDKCDGEGGAGDVVKTCEFVPVGG